jgi:RNA polymerase sigma-70 factor (ECF subfamily)
MPVTEHVAAAVAQAVRTQRLSIMGTLVRVLRDFDLAEDCLQDAVERALARWPADGVPDNPGAWLTVTARHRALDILRRKQTEREKLPELLAMTNLVSPPEEGTPTPYDDDRLKLLFACCHPALPLAARVALTLKTVTGLSTREVARAFLVSEATMGQRLLRAKTKITNAGIALRVPPKDQLDGRIDGVLSVVYLLFNEGYSATEGEPLREELSREALQLGTLLVQLLPAHDEARCLLALMLLQHSRRYARVSADGDLVPLDEQDRGLWDRSEIDAGLRLLVGSFDGPAGPYRLQAAIAALHATAAQAEATDWPRIVRAYDALLALAPSPVVALNRLIAVGFRDGPQAALDELPTVAGELGGYPLLPAVRADLLRRSGRRAEAAAAYREAIAVAGTDAERRFLRRRLDEVGGE